MKSLLYAVLIVVLLWATAIAVRATADVVPTARTITFYVDEPLHCAKRYQIGVQVAAGGTTLFPGVPIKGKTFWACGDK